jgi:oligoribonuclease (3'-5' exoribonuclease)
MYTLKWILEHDAIPCVIPGFNSVAQVEDFTVKEMAKLAHFYKYEVHREIKGAY